MRGILMTASLALAVAVLQPAACEGTTVRAWGEPHIWAYRQPWVVTCSAPGWQTYLNNEYMTVWVHNWKKYATSPWTVMTQALIMLKNPMDGSTIATYYAPDTTSPLPSTFQSPVTTSVSSPSVPLTHLVSMYSWSSYKIIRHHVAQTVIVLGGKRGNIILSMVIGLPNVLAEVTSGFLIDGCPASQVIGIPQGRRRRQISGCSKYMALMGACQYDSDALGEDFALASAEAVTTASVKAAEEARSMKKEMEAREDEVNKEQSFDEPPPPPRDDPDVRPVDELSPVRPVDELCEGTTVRAWGEPHIWAYRQPWVVTCSAPGWQTYLNNEYMTVWVHNWKKYATSPWTVMAQAFIMLKNPMDGSTIATYYAPDTTSPLPSTFQSPVTTSVSSPSVPLTHLVSMYSWSSYRIIRHHVAHTVIVLGGKRGNIILSMVIGLPNVLAEVTSGFLIDGCPASQVIGIPQGRRRRQISGCSKYRALMGACQYDSEALGEDFALASAEAVTTASVKAAKEARSMKKEMEAREDDINKEQSFDDPPPPPRDDPDVRPVDDLSPVRPVDGLSPVGPVDELSPVRPL